MEGTGISFMFEFLINVITLAAAIFVGSVTYDWWRKKNLWTSEQKD